MKHLKLIFLLGLIIRLVIMVTAIHPDFRAVNLAASFIVERGEVFSFYDHISRLPRTDWLVQLYGDNLFIYPPLAYLFHAPFYAILHSFYPTQSWNALINDIGSIRTTPNYQILLFLLKVPYLVIDLICFAVILKKFPETQKAHIAATMWWINPVGIYVAYAISQFDIIIAACILGALLSKKPSVSAIWLGIAACFKPFPLALLPFLPGSKVKNTLIGVSIYILTLIPYLFSPAFKMYALFADQSSKLLFAKVYVSATQYVSLFIVLYCIILFVFWLKPKLLPINAWPAAILLLFYSITNFHPQWFMWFAPYTVMFFVLSKSSRIVLATLLLTYIGIVLSFEPSLHFGLFNLSFSPYTILSRFIVPDELTSWIRSLFAVSAILLLIRVSPKTTSR